MQDNPFDGYLGRRGVGDRGKPWISGVDPQAGSPGTTVSIRGRNLAGARLRFGGRPASVIKASRNSVLVEVPDARGRVEILADSAFGRSNTVTFDVIERSSYGAFTFRGDAHSFGGPGHSIVATAVDQPYLILAVRPSDLPLPTGVTEAQIVADIAQRCATSNMYWREASYGKTSFTFDVHPTVLDLPDPMEAYDRPSEPKLVLGSGVTYPVTMAGTETLDLTGDEDLEVSVTFVAGDLTLGDVVTAIDDAIDAEYAGAGDPPISAGIAGGQLQLQTSREAADAVLDVASDAVGLLGLGPDEVTVTNGVDRVDDDFKKVRDALVARVEGMNDADADAYLSTFDGVGVVFAAGTFRASATSSGWNFDIRDEQYSFSNFNIDSTYPWEVWAHEIGHNLTFPDLYDEPGDPEFVGVEPGDWDIMHCSYCDAHPSAWIKHHRTAASGSWMTSIETVEAPPGTATAATQALLVPTSTPMPTGNPFAGSHPGVPLRHAIEIVLSPDRSLYVENRQRNFDSPEFGTTAFDNGIPDEGIIVTDAVNTMDGLPVFRSWIVMRTDYTDALNADGEQETVLNVTPANRIKVRIVERLGADPSIFHVEVTWGQGSFFDYRISDWQPPPWESSDIWIDTRVDNDWDEYTHADAVRNPDVSGNPVLNGDRSRVGWESRVYARVWNDGDIPRNGVRVRFQIVLPAAIGPSPGFDIGEDVIDLPAGGFGLARVNWTPRDANEGHVCVRAMVDADPDELNANNNMGQENITDWYLEGSSPYLPVTFPYQVTNPLPRRTLVRMAVRGLWPGWFVTLDPVQFWLEPGESILGHASLLADVSVPYEDHLGSERMPVPLLSIEAHAKYNDAWAPFGGVSGTAHPVRRANLEVFIDPAGDRVHVGGRAWTGDGPVRDANVTLRLLASDCHKVLTVERTRSDDSGVFQHELKVPDPAEFYFLEVLLSPTLGTGPAEHGPVVIEPVDGSDIRPGPPRIDFPEIERSPLGIIRRWLDVRRS